MVLVKELLYFILVLVPEFLNDLLTLILVVLHRSPHDIQLSPALIEGIRHLLQLERLGLYLDSEACLNVFSDAHAQDVGIDREHHLLTDVFEFSLLAIKGVPPFIETSFILRLQVLL